MSAWTIEPQKFGFNTAEDHRRLCIGIAFEINTRLTLGTPVDTGRAQNNWLPTIGVPATMEVEAIKEKNVAMGTAVHRANAEFEKAPLFPNLYITNNVEYIVDLDMGTSQQAPNGIVDLAIQAVAENAGGVQL